MAGAKVLTEVKVGWGSVVRVLRGREELQRHLMMVLRGGFFGLETVEEGDEEEGSLRAADIAIVAERVHLISPDGQREREKF